MTLAIRQLTWCLVVSALCATSAWAELRAAPAVTVGADEV